MIFLASLKLRLSGIDSSLWFNALIIRNLRLSEVSDVSEQLSANLLAGWERNDSHWVRINRVRKACVLHFVAIETNNASFCCKKGTTLSESLLKHISVLNKRSISVQSKSSWQCHKQR